MVFIYVYVISTNLVNIKGDRKVVASSVTWDSVINHEIYSDEDV